MQSASRSRMSDQYSYRQIKYTRAHRDGESVETYEKTEVSQDEIRQSRWNLLTATPFFFELRKVLQNIEATLYCCKRAVPGVCLIKLLSLIL
jgi:hypothetical protein